MKTIAPSVKTLVASRLCDRSTLGAHKCALLVRRIIKGKVAPTALPEQFPKTCAWVNSCYHQPKSQDIKLNALNELLGCHGVEAILDQSHFPPTLYFDYLNTGDTYSATLVRFPGGRYVVSSWGDAVERMERKGITIP